MRCRSLLGALVVASALAGAAVLAQEETPAPSAPDELTGEIAAKEAELSDIAEKIRALKEERSKKERQRASLTSAVEILEGRVRQSHLELDHTEISIIEVRLRIRQTAEELLSLTSKEGRLKEQLAELLRLLALLDLRSPLEVIVGGGTFADFLSNRQAVTRLQANTSILLTRAHDAKRVREERERDLNARSTELEQLAKLQAAQRAALKAQETQKRRTLAQTAREATRTASLLAEAEEARREIQQEVFVLKNAGLRLSLRQAEDFARHAGGLTGVRPALLLGVLKVESNLGTNVGSGRYPDDVHPDHREAFLRVVEKLGLDPAATPVSAKPTTYQGWGGALGPGQILPGIWESVEPEVARLTGKSRPSPFDLLDAFTATAVLLRNAGAASGNEFEAVNRYFAGPNWQRFTWYGDRVLAVAKEYEARGL